MCCAVFVAMKKALPEPLHECIPSQDYLATADTTPLCYVLLPVTAIATSTGGSQSNSNAMDTAAQLSELQSITKELYVRVLAKTSGTAIEEWLDEQYLSSVPAEIPSYSEDYSETWKCCALIEALVYVGGIGRTMSNLTSVLDRYSEILRSYAYNAENGPQAMLCTLHHLYSSISGSNTGDWGMFNVALDMLIRRNIITCTAALEWLLGSNKTDVYFSGIPTVLYSNLTGGLINQIINANVENTESKVAGHHWVWDHVETVVTRGFDFVLAAIARKDELLMQIETTNNEINEHYQTLSNMPESTAAAATTVAVTSSSSVVVATSGDAEMSDMTLAATQKEDDSDSDNEAGGRSKRRRGGEVDNVITYNQNNHPDDEDEDVNAGPTRSDITLTIEHLQTELTKIMGMLESVSESLNLSITSARESFVVVVGQLMLQINQRYAAVVASVPGSEAEDALALDPLLVTLRSLLKYVLRLYENHQIQVIASLAPGGAVSVSDCMLTDRAAVELLTVTDSAVPGMITLTTSAGIGQSLVSNPLVQRTWNQFA